MRDSHEPVGLNGRVMHGRVPPVGALRGKASAMSVHKDDSACDPPRRTPPEPPVPTRRERILRAVSETYGITYGQILRRTGLTNGVAAYHVSSLQREGRLWKATYDGRPHFFGSRKAVEGMICITKAERVALTLPSDRAVTVKEASARVGMPPSTVRRCLAVLKVALGVVGVALSVVGWLISLGSEALIEKLGSLLGYLDEMVSAASVGFGVGGVLSNL